MSIRGSTRTALCTVGADKCSIRRHEPCEHRSHKLGGLDLLAMFLRENLGVGDEIAMHSTRQLDGEPAANDRRLAVFAAIVAERPFHLEPRDVRHREARVSLEAPVAPIDAPAVPPPAFPSQGAWHPPRRTLARLGGRT